MLNKLLTLLLLSSTLLTAAEPPQSSGNHILYLIKSNHVKEAIQAYKNYYKARGRHDFDLLEQIGMSLLDQGAQSQDPEILLLTYFGAGISMNEKALRILKDGISSPIPQLQLICLNLLAQFNHDEADEFINKAMNSSEALVRLEAALHLAEKKSPKAFAQIESLMHKMIPEVLPLFPQLYALLGNREAEKMLKKLLIHPDQNVRIATILSIAKFDRDDFLPNLRRMLSHPGYAQQEACAYAVGHMRDESSASKLKELIHSKYANVQLAAAKALYQLGREEASQLVAQAAAQGHVFAIKLLGNMEKSDPILIPLLQNSNPQIRFNAALALLERKNAVCTKTITEILIRNHRDYSIEEITSIGKTLTAWKLVPNARQNGKDDPLILEISLNAKEEILEKSLSLPEESFLQIAEAVFKNNQNDLVPITIQLLSDLGTPEAIQLLKLYKEQPGAPLIRNYCNLALYTLKEEGPYLQNLKKWLLSQQKEDLIKLRPFVPWEMRSSDATYQLTPEETSRLVIQSYEAFVGSRDEEGINILLEGISADNKKNRFGLAGLLMRAAQ